MPGFAGAAEVSSPPPPPPPHAVSAATNPRRKIFLNALVIVVPSHLVVVGKLVVKTNEQVFTEREAFCFTSDEVSVRVYAERFKDFYSNPTRSKRANDRDG